MADFLEQIVASKRREIAAARTRVPEAELRAQATAHREHRSLAAALAPGGVRVIAEIKRASPSAGVLAADLDPAALARAYAAGGAAALSVLTDAPFFHGSFDDLRAARAATRLPVLRKDFILDPYQIYDSAALGADAILLIVRLLDDAQLRDFLALAAELGLDALVEVHDAADAARAARLAPRLVGINNRDLARFATDTANALRLARAFGPETRVVAASGIRDRAQIEAAQAAGIDCFLIGESLVRAADPAAALRRLIHGEPAP